MTPLSIITDALKAIPPWVRQLLLLAYALAVVVVAIGHIWELAWDFDKIDQTLVYVGGYLSIQSAANVGNKDLPPGEAGMMAVED